MRAPAIGDPAQFDRPELRQVLGTAEQRGTTGKKRYDRIAE